MFDWVAAAAARRTEPRSSEPTKWRPVRRSSPCPICGKPDWCSIAENKPIAFCMRVSEGALREKDTAHGTGWIHQVDGDLPPVVQKYSTAPERSETNFELDCQAILKRWREATKPEWLDALAQKLSVSRSAIEQLDTAWCAEKRAWAFPMHNDRRDIVGFRLRTDSGQKFALTGSHAGAFIPWGLDSRSTLLICEGPTDTAAALTLGYQAIGRPSCSGATEIVCNMLQVGRRRDVVIIADADGPGRGGAKRLADRLFGLVRSIRVITAVPHKDLRAWLATGGTRTQMDLRIEQALYHRPV